MRVFQQPTLKVRPRTLTWDLLWAPWSYWAVLVVGECKVKCTPACPLSNMTHTWSESIPARWLLVHSLLHVLWSFPFPNIKILLVRMSPPPLFHDFPAPEKDVLRDVRPHGSQRLWRRKRSFYYTRQRQEWQLYSNIILGYSTRLYLDPELLGS